MVSISMYKYIKPLLDRVMALIMIVLLSPIMIATAILIYLRMGKPLVFSQLRPGLYEEPFTIYKFRSMSDEKDADGKLLSDELRLKGIGVVIRKLSLDELPQLFNVLKGEMSFIGPRPLLPEYLPLYNQVQKRRHEVKPGITGWAQVNGRNAISWEKKFELDVWYVENISFLIDMKIMMLTILKVMKRDGVSAANQVTIEKFKGSR